jgi:hypothetical protein
MNPVALIFALSAVAFLVSLIPEQRVSWQTVGLFLLALGFAVGAWL